MLKKKNKSVRPCTCPSRGPGVGPFVLAGLTPCSTSDGGCAEAEVLVALRGGGCSGICQRLSHLQPAETATPSPCRATATSSGPASTLDTHRPGLPQYVGNTVNLTIIDSHSDQCRHSSVLTDTNPLCSQLKQTKHLFPLQQLMPAVAGGRGPRLKPIFF